MKKYTCISTDDHIVEAPDTWSKRMDPKKWGDMIPRSADIGTSSFQGGAGFMIGDRPMGNLVVNATMPDRTVNPKTWDEVPTFNYIAAERVKAMDEDGVDIHTLHPLFATNLINDTALPEDFRLDMMRAYNDFIMEEYGDPFPLRFILLITVAHWDPAEAVKEFHRCLARSSAVRGVNFVFPQAFGYTNICDPAWDPLWAALQEADFPLHLHIGSGGSVGMRGVIWEGITDPMRILAEVSTKSISAHTSVAATLLFSGILERFPRLKIVLAESGAGWVPYLLDLADHQWERQRLGTRGMDLPPSELFREHCYTNFWFEKINDEVRRQPGTRNLMWLSDFPHPTATYPTSQQYIEESFKTATPEEKYDILVGNPLRVYNLPEGY